MPIVTEKRAAVAAKYRTIIGRNIYSQNLRNYCYKKYSNGNYYSDCSSSICYTYKECGYGFGIMNTVGMLNSTKLVDVPVEIKNGQVVDPTQLRIGDMLLFAGKDNSRPMCVGHVEMVGEINGKTIMLYGHGSGNPKRHEMTAYCRSRYSKKTNTKIGHTGLIKVRRYFVDADVVDPGDTFEVLKIGSKGAAVTAMQEALMALGYDLPEWGADGEFGVETETALNKFKCDRNLIVDGRYDAETDAALLLAVDALAATYVQITGSSVNVRKGADLASRLVGTVHRNDLLPFGGEQVGTWFRVTYDQDPDCWVTSKYSEIKKG